MGDIEENKKLIWLGLKRAQQDPSEARDHIDRLSRQVDFDDYESEVATELSSFDDHSLFLEENEFTNEQAESFNEMIQNNFDGSWSNYEDFVVDEAGSYITLRNGFGTQTAFESDLETEDGDSLAGLRIHESSGVSYAGVSVPAGTVEIYGDRVEFSKTGSPDPTSADISFSNLSVPSSAKLGETVEITADVTNSGDADGDVYASLQEDGVVVERDKYTINAGQSTSVSFTRSYTEDGSISITINDLEEQTLFVRRAL